MTATEQKSRIPEIHLEQLSAEQRALIERLEAARGRVPTPFKIWIHNPAIADPLLELGARLTRGVSLSRREREIAILLMAHHWSAEYVLEIHSREASEAGLPQAVIAELRVGIIPEIGDPRERSVCAIVADFLQKTGSNDGTFDSALAALGQEGLAELLVLCGYFTSICLAMKLYRMPLPVK